MGTTQKFVIMDEIKNGGDSWSEFYDSLEEANDAAESMFTQLSKYDKKRHHIYVGLVKPDLIREDLKDDDYDEDNWYEYCTDMGIPDNAYDSEKGKIK